MRAEAPQGQRRGRIIGVALVIAGVVLSIALPRRVGAWFGSGLVSAGAIGVFGADYRARIAARGRVIAYAASCGAAIVILLLLLLKAGASPQRPAEAAPRASADRRGWVIPRRIVRCESGGVNLPPNNAGAAGYYQITSETWSDAGGPAPDDASRHSKAEQDAVASRLWARGEGAGRWVCK